MSHLQNPVPVSISLLALPESTPTALYGLFELFSAVGSAWEQVTGERAPARRILPRIVASGLRPIISPVGLPIEPQASLRQVQQTDIVIVTDLSLAPDTDLTNRWSSELRWIGRQFAHGATVCSVCTGAVALAEAGLLDGHEATTHWSASALFQRRYPSVKLHRERVLCPAGPDQRIITSGGSASWEDLALYLIARLSGEAEALRIAKLFLLGDRTDGQLPFTAMGRPRAHNDAVVRRSQGWLADHFTITNPVSRMVQLSGLPERTFKRRFKNATGYAPVEYVQMLRIEQARHLLETTRLPTDSVAYEVGYDDPAFFRRLFKRQTGVTPARYRQRIQAVIGLGSGH